MATMPTVNMKKRLYFVVIVAILVAFSIVATSVVKITVVQHDMYLAKATKQQLKPKTITANRGTIYDRNMNVIAQSGTVYDVIISPATINKQTTSQLSTITTVLSEAIGGDSPEEVAKIRDKVATLAKKIDRSYEIVAKKVEKVVADKIREGIIEGTPGEGGKKVALKGIDLIESSKRYYPDSYFAPSVIGFTGSDSQGLYGIELKYDEELSGTPGYIVSAQNAVADSVPISYEEKFDPVHGNNLVLTIDESIQHFLEKALEKSMSEQKPIKGCAGIVMNVNTGEILAMANLPTFNLNDPWTISTADQEAISLLPEAEREDATSKARQNQWINTNVSYTYQPGSTIKTMVAAAALEEKTASMNSTYPCHGFIQVADAKMGCHIGGSGHGSLDFTGALVNSCNPAFVKIGADLGAQSFFKYFKNFGLTQKTGIDLPAENLGNYYTADKLGIVELASSSFGQSMAVTPIQLITAVSAVVNGGNLVTPHVVKDILDQNGNIIKSTATEVKRQVISEETSAQLRQMMEQVVDQKGGTNAQVMGYRIGGKSGTSQKQNPGDSKEARIASYVGVAPIDNPEIAVFVMIDEPTSGKVYGSVVAAPAISLVMRDALPYLGYSPQYTAEQSEMREVVIPTLTGLGILEAEGKLTALGLSAPRVIGDGPEVYKQVPGVGEKMPKDGVVIFYTDNVGDTTATVPDVVGLTPTAAKAKLEKLKFNVRINGMATEHKNSKISAQSVAEGTELPIGTVIEITCLKEDTD